MRTKIVCTIGPASSGKAKLKQMLKAGMTVARINFSHGSHESNGALLRILRQAALEVDQSLGIMADLQGPRIRIAGTDKPTIIKENENIYLYEEQKGSPHKLEKENVSLIGIDTPNLLAYLKKGDVIYIDNGMMEVYVVGKKEGALLCKVRAGGVIKARKGVNIPRISSRMEAFTKSDQKNLEFALAKNVDFIAMSFVKTAKDIVNLRKKIKNILKGEKEEALPKIIAKIETQSAVKNFDEILKVVDGIMIGRGDLAIELPLERIPVLQKEMVKKCLHNAKPVIVATQMLESMMENPRPTRAEISDVSNAVIDHADALMLSGESAMGKYPAKSVQVMAKIIKYTEADPYDDLDYKQIVIKELVPFAFVAKAAVMMAVEMKLKNIIIRNCPIAMAYKVSRFRPEIDIWYLTKNKEEARQLSLVWGVQAIEEFKGKEEGHVLIDGIRESSGRIEYKIKHSVN